MVGASSHYQSITNLKNKFTDELIKSKNLFLHPIIMVGLNEISEILLVFYYDRLVFWLWITTSGLFPSQSLFCFKKTNPQPSVPRFYLILADKNIIISNTIRLDAEVAHTKKKKTNWFHRICPQLLGPTKKSRSHAFWFHRSKCWPCPCTSHRTRHYILIAKKKKKKTNSNTIGQVMLSLSWYQYVR